MNEIRETFSKSLSKSTQIFQTHLEQVENERLQIEQNNANNAFRKFERFVS